MKTKIKNFEFAYNKQLVEYAIPDGITEIGDYAFPSQVKIIRK